MGNVHGSLRSYLVPYILLIPSDQRMEKYPGWVLDAIIDLTNIEGRIEGSCCGGLDTCTNRRDALLSFVIKYEQKS